MTTKKDYSLKNYYEEKEVLNATGNGNPVIIPSGGLTSISVQLDGDGKVQVTNYSEEDIEADNAVWLDVPEGADINTSVSAIRQVNVSGTTTLNVRCQ